MALIADDWHAVRSEDVHAVEKPWAEELWFLSLSLAGGSEVEFRFPSLDARDSFYKELVEAMRA